MSQPADENCNQSPRPKRTYRGQSYVCIAVEPHVRRDGIETRLEIWHSHCAQCDAPFEFKRSAKAVKFQPNRRCPAHKHPGVRVGKPMGAQR